MLEGLKEKNIYKSKYPYFIETAFKRDFRESEKD